MTFTEACEDAIKGKVIFLPNWKKGQMLCYKEVPGLGPALVFCGPKKPKITGFVPLLEERESTKWQSK